MRMGGASPSPSPLPRGLAGRLRFPADATRHPGRHEVVDALLEMEDGSTASVVVKKAALDARQRRAGRTRAERALATAARLREASVDTPEPLGCETVGDESWFVTRRVEGATQVRAWFWHRADPVRIPPPPGAPSFEEVARGVGTLARRIHDAGVFFRDFTDGNVLVTVEGGRGRFWLVDLDRAVLRERVGPLARLRDLSRPGLNGRDDRNLLLEGYFAPSPVPAWARIGVSLLRSRIRAWDELKRLARPWRR